MERYLPNDSDPGKETEFPRLFERKLLELSSKHASAHAQQWSDVSERCQTGCKNDRKGSG